MITAPQILPIIDLKHYKVHLASWNGENAPLDTFVRDRAIWDQWNTWRSAKNDFNREYIFSMMEFYPQPGVWLFGGIYKVLGRSIKSYEHSYTVMRENVGEEFVGRLKIKFKRPSRSRSLRLENYYNQMEVFEILQDVYSGEAFPGYENIHLKFTALETIIHTQRKDWKAALQSVKGVYLIYDQSDDKKYVGSAYGSTGLWSRWSTYVETGHGHNDELRRTIEDRGIEYARKNFEVTLLEYRPSRTDDQEILAREVFWKEVLHTRGKSGYNKN